MTHKESMTVRLDIEHHANTLARWASSAQNLTLQQVAGFKKNMENDLVENSVENEYRKMYSIFYNFGIMEWENNLDNFKTSLPLFISMFRDDAVPERFLKKWFSEPIKNYLEWFSKNGKEAKYLGIDIPYLVIEKLCLVTRGNICVFFEDFRDSTL